MGDMKEGFGEEEIRDEDPNVVMKKAQERIRLFMQHVCDRIAQLMYPRAEVQFAMARFCIENREIRGRSFRIALAR